MINKIIYSIGLAVIFSLGIFSGTFSKIGEYIEYSRIEVIPYIPMEIRIILFGCIIFILIELWKKFTS